MAKPEHEYEEEVFRIHSWRDEYNDFLFFGDVVGRWGPCEALCDYETVLRNWQYYQDAECHVYMVRHDTNSIEHWHRWHTRLERFPKEEIITIGVWEPHKNDFLVMGEVDGKSVVETFTTYDAVKVYWKSLKDTEKQLYIVRHDTNCLEYWHGSYFLNRLTPEQAAAYHKGWRKRARAQKRKLARAQKDEGKTMEITILNFSHPLTEEQLTEIKNLAGYEIAGLQTIAVQINQEEPLEDQVTQLLAQAQLTPTEWQTQILCINPPGYAPVAATLLAAIHGRCGHFPPMIRMAPIPNGGGYRVAEILHLQGVRDNSRKQRA